MATIFPSGEPVAPPKQEECSLRFSSQEKDDPERKMDGSRTDRTLTIDGREISDATECYVIAEVGHNHQGSVDTCKELFDEAKACGADAVKLQKRDNRLLYTRDFFEKPYENENSFGLTYGEHREALEFDKAQYKELQDHADDIGITFLATAFDHPSVDFLASLNMPAFKVASADLTNLPLLRHVAEIGKPMILSTGAATLEDVDRAYEAVTAINHHVALLQCTAGYPAAWDELDLRVIETYRERFPSAVVGLSGHDNGISMPVVAYVLGARIVEKHFTLNRAMKGTDHRFSLEPQGLRKMVRDLRRTRRGLGSPEKRMYPSEVEPAIKMGKKLVAGRDLPAGHRLRPGDIALKSPGDGLAPYELERVVGCLLRERVSEDTTLRLEMLEEEAEAATVAGSGRSHEG
jgi:N-acetylneuraminate synthase/sialic acid synthase